jgi:hypothetical protein
MPEQGYEQGYAGFGAKAVLADKSLEPDIYDATRAVGAGPGVGVVGVA